MGKVSAFGFTKDKEIKVTYDSYLDNYVKIRTNSGISYLGKLVSTDLDYTVLNPSLSHTSYFDIIDYGINKDNTIINTGRIESIEPIKENYLEKIVKQSKIEQKKLNKINKKKNGRKRKKPRN